MASVLLTLNFACAHVCCAFYYSGVGVSVMELLQAVEKASGKKVAYK